METVGQPASLSFKSSYRAAPPAITAHLLSNYYNQTRAEYYRQLDLASKRPDGRSIFLVNALGAS